MLRPNSAWAMLGLCWLGAFCPVACAHDEAEISASNAKDTDAALADSNIEDGVGSESGIGPAGSGGTPQGEGGPWPDSGGGGVSDSGTDASSGSGGTSGTGGTGGTGTSGTGGSPCVAESCNNIDDDCNGQIDDGLSQPCATSCGSGTRNCQAGAWGECSAGNPIVCTNYTSCQNESMCVASCPAPPSEACNVKDDDCDGACDEGASCRDVVFRSIHSSTGEHFYSRDSSEASCCGYTIENSNAFWLYPDNHSGLAALYRCLLANGMHFYTQSSNCEGAASSTLEGVLGYLATSNICGSIPLYRLTKSSTGDHLYTTSAAERDAAVQTFGYQYESIAGYVWSSQ